MTHPPLHNIRNIGIISHIDAGKTTVSERILYYCDEIHKMGEVHEGQAQMDWMPQEQERGITITATSATCQWREWWINLIDTPGHIDFTIEVERSMRVLDGAIAVFSAVEGVQPQSESVWRQASRYGVPRICFINKMDRIGSDYRMVLAQIEQRLAAKPALMHLPLGNEGDFSGIIDLLSGELITFDESDLGRTVLRGPIPGEMAAEAATAREQLVEAAADFDDGILGDFLSGEPVSAERLRAALRKGTLECRIFPVLLGTALRNKGIQPLLDAVGQFLPAPTDVKPPDAVSSGCLPATPLPCDPQGPFCALAFKVQAEEGRKLTYLRAYSGECRVGSPLYNSNRCCFEKGGRFFRMHAHRREAVDSVRAGEIIAVAGLRETLTGDTICDPAHHLLLEGLTIPEPVVSLAVEPKGADDREKFAPALEKLTWEDPTFRVHEDSETGQTILTGMGELHLEVIVERLKREYGVHMIVGRPQVVYRETIGTTVERRELFHFEADGKVQHGEALLRLEPLTHGSGVRIILSDAVCAGVTRELAASLHQGIIDICSAGCFSGYPLTDIAVHILEAPLTPGVTTEAGIKAAARRGLMLAVREAQPKILEPVMALEIITPAEATGKVIGSLRQKRGRVEGMESQVEIEIVRALVPLASLFGYMTELRSATRGRGTFTMEFARFETAPDDVQKSFGL